MKTGDVLAAVGLTFEDLFPKRPTHHAKAEALAGARCFRAVAGEATIVAVAASTICSGGNLTAEDRQRVMQAGARLNAAVLESGHE